MNSLAQEWNFSTLTFFLTHFRSDSLDSILRLIEELSAIDNCSKVMSSNDQLIKALSNIVKLPDKFEVSMMLLTVHLFDCMSHLTSCAVDPAY